MGKGDCPYVARGETEDDVMQKVAEHATSVHHMEMSAEMKAQAKSLIRDE
jgi:predicted small metal-binding protein